MRPAPHVPGPGVLLRLWEESRRLHAVDRALAVLRATYPEVEPRAAADCSAGERDALLLAARGALFGPRIDARADCPGCGELHDVTLDVPQLTLASSGASRTADVTVRAGGHDFRLPTSRDIAAALDPDSARMAREIARQCFAGEGPCPDLPDDLLHELNERLAEADPQADVELSLACGACGLSWTVPFDVGTLLWAEIDTRVRALFSDVDVLARAYGWSENEILALGDTRRATYVELACA